MKEFKSCKYCGAQIPHQDNKCPSCGKRQIKIGTIVALYAVLIPICAFILFSGMGESEENKSVSSEEMEQSAQNFNEDYYVEPTEWLEELSQIDRSITNALQAKGYSIEHASEIQEILNTLGIQSIIIQHTTGSAEDGLNSVVCYPNGNTDEDHRFYFTTEDGVLFYAGFLNEDLYDSERGGYLKNYNNVHVPEKEVTTEIYDRLRSLAINEVKSCLNYPNTADFNSFSWGVGRSDNNYQIIGSVTAENAFGVEEEIPFSVWFMDGENGFTTEGVALNGVRVK